MFWQHFYDATMYIWLLAGIVLMFRLQVFIPGPLRIAPPRRSTLSLPIVGGVLLLYLIVLTAASLLALATHLLPPPPDAIDAPAATLPTASAPATFPATIATTIATTAAASSPDAATSPAPTTSSDSKDYTVIDQAVGGSAELLVVGVFTALAWFFFSDGYRGWGLAAQANSVRPSQRPDRFRHGLPIADDVRQSL